VVGVEQWAEIRRLHFVKGLSQREIRRRTGLHRDTIRRAINSTEPPVYRRAPAGSKLDPFKDEIHRMLKEDHKLSGVRVRELLEPLGCTASKTVVDDYLREVRPLFAPPPRTFQRTVYRPGELCQFDLWEPRDEVPVGHGQTRRGWVVIACLGYSRAGAGMLIFSKQTEDLLAGIAGCLQRLGALPRTLVWDRQAGLHARDGQPTEAFAAFCGQLKVGWRFCQAADPQAKGVVERFQGYAETNFEPGRVFANQLDFPGSARRLVGEGQRARTQDAPRTAGRSPRHRARGDGAVARAHARHLTSVGDARPARPASQIRHQRLQPGSGAGRPARRGHRRSAHGHGGRA
jgi:transposase